MTVETAGQLAKYRKEKDKRLEESLAKAQLHLREAVGATAQEYWKGQIHALRLSRIIVNQ